MTGRQFDTCLMVLIANSQTFQPHVNYTFFPTFHRLRLLRRPQWRQVS